MIETDKKILDILKESGEPLKPGDIVARTGLKKEDVDRAINRLKKEEKIFSPKRCFYGIRK
jgi:DNA-binding IclR family transcriptional regulator